MNRLRRRSDELQVNCYSVEIEAEETETEEPKARSERQHRVYGINLLGQQTSLSSLYIPGQRKLISGIPSLTRAIALHTRRYQTEDKNEGRTRTGVVS